uniref:ADP-ribose pyrophosphatase, mitochondrial n=1 Tax=Trichuris muris TaxID=70415 RepID=A0A5S6QK53_TRIMR
MDTPFASFATWALFLLQTIFNTNANEVQHNIKVVPVVILPPSLERPEPVAVHELEKNWTTDFPGYSPTPWNAPCLAKSCDPQIQSIPKNEFNKRSSNMPVDRKRVRCCCTDHYYTVKDGYPLNPSGRTGLSGRGLFPRWGPNHYVKLLFVKQEKVGKEVEQFLLSLNGTENLDNAYFEGFVDKPKQEFFPVDLREAIRHDLLTHFKDEEKVAKIMKKAFKRSVRVMGGSLPSHMNTDHAWVEGQVHMVPCEKNEEICKYGLTTVQTKQGYKWFFWDRKSTMKKTRLVAKTLPADDDDTKYELTGYSIFCRGCYPDMRPAMLGAAGIWSLTAIVITVRYSIISLWLATLVSGAVGLILLPFAVLIAALVLYDFMERLRMK